MKRAVFFVILVLVLECQCFEFKNLFRSYPDASSYSSSSVPTSSLSYDLFQTDENLENVSFSFDEVSEQEYNATILSLNNMLESAALHPQNESLPVISSTEHILNTSEFIETTSESKLITSTEESASTTQASRENSTASIQIKNSTDSSLSNFTTSTEEVEEVVIGSTPSTFTYYTKTIYRKTADFFGDPYTLSIFVPIAAGVLFALTIICTIAACRCMKRKCHRRRFRKRVLPDSVKSLRPSDQARLLGDCYDSSDEEF